ncbi:hypothetical protein AAZX31_12G166900 [Glycine max]|uniref:Heavy metal-associated isoprenylated plant protein 3 n=2 Tax=Glycine soja TaxID=3848 RepID=A0A445HRU8_GLYSO|nr:hypothetical protein GLYMA_12G177600v4 [Glycine max]KAH1143698.1 hypothetical protein GYH30_034098 [Glycine max]RZB76390.1 Heavy metal-associated isoprenylated plant protein 3 [Glycine soja]
MGQKQTKKSDYGHKKNKEKDKGKKKEETTSSNPTTLVLKVDMHCEGCASRIVKCVCGFEGVESLKPEIETGKLTVTGNVDPAKLRDKLARKMKKNVDIVSSLPNKDKPKNNDKKSKDKEAPVTTAVLKVTALCPCQGCSDRVRRAVLKTKGVKDVGIDREKGMVMVKGTMDVTALAKKLKEKFKRNVEVVPPKKEKEKGKEKESDEKGENGSAKKKKKGDNGHGGGKGNTDKDNESGGDNCQGKMDQNIVSYMVPAYGYGYGYGEYSNNYMGQYHPVSQMFSDENPYACHIM